MTLHSGYDLLGLDCASQIYKDLVLLSLSSLQRCKDFPQQTNLSYSSGSSVLMISRDCLFWRFARLLGLVSQKLFRCKSKGMRQRRWNVSCCPKFSANCLCCRIAHARPSMWCPCLDHPPSCRFCLSPSIHTRRLSRDNPIRASLHNLQSTYVDDSRDQLTYSQAVIDILLWAFTWKHLIELKKLLFLTSPTTNTAENILYHRRGGLLTWLDDWARQLPNRLMSDPSSAQSPIMAWF